MANMENDEICYMCFYEDPNCAHCLAPRKETMHFYFYNKVMAENYAKFFIDEVVVVKDVLQKLFHVENVRNDINVDEMVNRWLAFAFTIYGMEKGLAFQAHEVQSIICSLALFQVSMMTNWCMVPEAVAQYVYHNTQTQSNCQMDQTMAQFNTMLCTLINWTQGLDLDDHEIHFVTTLLVLDNQHRPDTEVEKVYAVIRFYERNYRKDAHHVRYQHLINICTLVKEMVQMMGVSLLLSPLIQEQHVSHIQHNHKQVLGAILFKLPAHIV